MDYINTGMMLRHAAAFSLYLVGTTSLAIAIMISNLSPHNSSLFSLVAYTSMADKLSQFCSQLLLCEIFLHLATDTRKAAIAEQTQKPEEPEQDESDAIASLEVTDFDEDAEIQYNLWN